jgi:hypothetical protein
MSTLTELQERMVRLVEHRNAIVREAEAKIRDANRVFDFYAVPLAREIKRRQKHEPKKAPVLSRANFAGLTDEEIEHYKELQCKQTFT